MNKYCRLALCYLNSNYYFKTQLSMFFDDFHYCGNCVDDNLLLYSYRVDAMEKIEKAFEHLWWDLEIIDSDKAKLIYKYCTMNYEDHQLFAIVLGIMLQLHNEKIEIIANKKSVSICRNILNYYICYPSYNGKLPREYEISCKMYDGNYTITDIHGKCSSAKIAEGVLIDRRQKKYKFCDDLALHELNATFGQ